MNSHRVLLVIVTNAALLALAALPAVAASDLRPDRRKLPGVNKAWKRAQDAHGRGQRARVLRETTVEVMLRLNPEWSRRDAEKALAETKKASIGDVAALLAGELGHPRWRRNHNEALLRGMFALDQKKYYRGYNLDQRSNQMSEGAQETIRTALHIADYIQGDGLKGAAETSRMTTWVGLYDAAAQQKPPNEKMPFLRVLLEASEWAEMLINGGS
jgi:hypothetical protein